MAKEVLKISTILRMFTEEGLTREEIRVKLDCTKTEITEIFRHEKLKNLKACTKKFLLVDDTEENYAEDTATVNDIPVKDAEILATVVEVGSETTSDESDWIKEDEALQGKEDTTTEAGPGEDFWEDDQEGKVIDTDSAPTAEELEDDEAWE